MEKKVKLLMTSLPNFISVDQPAALKHDGWKEGLKIAVSDLSESEAEEYAEEMKQAFIQHCKIKRTQSTI